MSVKLSRQFTCPEEAELYFKQGDICQESKATVVVRRGDQHHVRALEKRTTGTQTERCPSVIDEILTLLMSVSEAEQLNMMDELLSATLKMLHINIDLPKDFVSKAVAGMQYLKKCQRYNIIYGIAKGFGSMICVRRFGLILFVNEKMFTFSGRRFIRTECITYAYM